MKKIIKLSIILTVLVLFSSCRLTDFTIVSTKNVQINVDKTQPRTKGWGWTVKGAIDKAIENSKGQNDALIDGVIYKRFIGYSAKGTPINTNKKN